MDKLQTLWHSTGLFHMSGGQLVMLLVCLVLLWLAIHKIGRASCRERV